jgi:hypothetical protein
MNRALTLGLAVLLLAGAGASSSSAQTARLNKVMRAKLDHAQRILEALVTSNWQQLERESREIARVAQDPAWTVLTMPQYMRHSQAFLRATDDLIEAARLRDLETSSLGFISLTTSCVSCHRYMARGRIAAGFPQPGTGPAPGIDLQVEWAGGRMGKMGKKE